MELLFTTRPAPSSAMQEVFRIAFRIATRELGIANYAAKVELHFAHLPPGHQGGTDGLLTGKGETVRIVLGLEDDDPRDVLSTFIHELTHAAQMLRGDLVGSERELSITWKGCHKYDARLLRERTKVDRAWYRELPWEKEARQEANRIIPLVLTALRANMERIDDLDQKEPSQVSGANGGASSNPTHL